MRFWNIASISNFDGKYIFFDKKNNNRGLLFSIKMSVILWYIEFWNKLNYTYLAENKNKTKW